MHDRIPAAAAFVALLAMAALAGCSSKDKNAEDETSQDFRNISRAYEVALNGGSPPKDIAKIRSILADLHAAKINPPPDEILISSRDNQPYVVLMGVKLGESPNSDIFIYEQTGAEGIRYVMTTSREIRKITAEEFAQATFANGHKPSSK